MNFEAYLDGVSLGIIESDLERAVKHFSDRAWANKGHRYELIELPHGMPARPNQRKDPRANMVWSLKVTLH
jgi:hypothetical protein